MSGLRRGKLLIITLLSLLYSSFYLKFLIEIALIFLHNSLIVSNL